MSKTKKETSEGQEVTEVLISIPKSETGGEQEVTAILTDKGTGEQYAFKGRGSYWKEGEDWGGSVNLTTNKAEAVVFELARYVATVEPGAPGVAEARRILQLVYQKLSSFTIGLREDGETFFCSWMVKDGLREAGVTKEIDEALSAEIFKVFVARVFAPEKLNGLQKPAEIVRGGDGVRVGAQWPKNRFEIKKAGKEARKITPEEIRFEFALLTLLRDYSEHRDKDHPLYLLGNGGEAFEEARVAIGGQRTSEEMRIAVLEIPQAALYTAYTGKKAAAISTPERRRVDGLLETLQSDIQKIIIKQEMPGGKAVKWYEMERPKITVDRVATLTEEEAAAREMGGELPEAKTTLRIKLHPGFTYDIGRRYNLFPDDYLPRMEKAIGGGRSGSKHWLLNEYLNGIRGQGKISGYETKADFETLVKILDLERFKKKQGAKATEAEIDEAVKVAKEVGLVLDWSKEPGAKGQKQWQFKLNPDFG